MIWGRRILFTRFRLDPLYICARAGAEGLQPMRKMGRADVEILVAELLQRATRAYCRFHNTSAKSTAEAEDGIGM